MKNILLIMILILGLVDTQFAHETTNKSSKIEWTNVILKNYATFRSLKDLDWGSSFLINYHQDIIACTAREFTQTYFSPGQMISIKDLDKELLWWKMYLPDEPTKFILMDSLVLRDRIEKKISILTLSKPFLTFALKNIHHRMIPLEPDVRRIRNNDTLFMVGYDNKNKLKIVQGIVETALKEKYTDNEIRIKTPEYLNFADFVGSPVVDRNGKVVGVFNRAYRLKIDHKGRIINESKVVNDFHFDYFVQATSMRSILGKDYVKESGGTKIQPPK